MEAVTAVLSSVLIKVGTLLDDEHSLSNEVSEELRLFKLHLEGLKALTEDVSSTPPGHLDERDKLWARDMRDISYDFEDIIDSFMVPVSDGSDDAPKMSLKLLHASDGTDDVPKPRIKLFAQNKIRQFSHGMRDIKRRLAESDERRRIYWVEKSVVKDVDGNHAEKIVKDVDCNMMKILPSSYYDLPQHLRVCLLYLSVFPEDHKIEKNRLIWMWIAEGFIRCERGRNLFELGDSYFSQLIDRSLIELRYDDITEYCHVNTVMFNLIRSLSREENFVTLDFDYERQASDRVRRLSFQNTKEEHAMTWATKEMPQVRSAIVCSSTVKILPVLDLHACFLSQAWGLRYIATLFQLRYLGLRGTGIADLPEEVGNLQFLQTLDITCNEISGLPTTFGNLLTLKCLRIDFTTRVPLTVFASLTSLEELSGICLYDSTETEILSRLEELTVLDISYHIEDMDYLEKFLVESLCKLQKIQNLSILVASGECKVGSLVFSTRMLRQLSLRGCWLSKLPAWVDPIVLCVLTAISIAIIELEQEHLEILGKLPALRYLNLKVDHENLIMDHKNLSIQERSIGGAYLFPRLVRCTFWGFRGPVVFHGGAMPHLRSLRFTFHVWDRREIAGSSDGAFDVGLTNLKSLQNVIVLFRCGGASEDDVKEAKDALCHVSKIHPNGPTIDIVG
jgi:hypothetical protein